MDAAIDSSLGAQHGSGAAGEIVKRLASAIVNVPDTDNVSTNVKLWNAYATGWTPAAPWVQTMAAQVHRDAETELPCIGCEWSDELSLKLVLREWFAPVIASVGSANLKVAEVGSGGGRIATWLAGQEATASLHCLDISVRMLEKCKAAIDATCGPETAARVKYTHLPTHDGVVDWPWAPELSASATATSSSASGAPTAGVVADPALIQQGTFDLIVCFDVLVHCDMHATYATLLAIAKMLRRGSSEGRTSRAIISTSNLLAPLGWQRFQSQKRGTPAGFCWTTPETVDLLVQKAGLAVVRRSWPPSARGGDHEAAAGAGGGAPMLEGDVRADASASTTTGNVYLDRDYLLVLQLAG